MADPTDKTERLGPLDDAIALGKSRAGDFVFAGAVGLCLVIAMSGASGLSFASAAVFFLVFAGALTVRYVALKDAPGVPVISAEQIEKLQRVRDLLNGLPQPILLLDADGVVDTHNPASAAMFGEGIVGRHISSVVRAPAALEVLRTVNATGAPYEAEFTTTGIQERTALFYAAPIAPGDKRLMVMVRDRTAQRKLERMRTDFVANASHELRTPLTSMAGFIETLQGHAKEDPEAQDRFLGIMSDQAERMLRLIEDLISLSSIEMNEAKTPDDAVDIVRLLGSVVENLNPAMVRTGGSVTIEKHVDVAVVAGDSHEIFRVLQNLCDNALKYGINASGDPANVIISVGAGDPPPMLGMEGTGDSAEQIAVRAGVPTGSLFWVRVQDSGRGIARDHLPRITERFYRVSVQDSRDKGGTGLGLAIVKHILQRHRAGFRVESREDAGTAFTCMFPPHPDRSAREFSDTSTDTEVLAPIKMSQDA